MARGRILVAAVAWCLALGACSTDGPVAPSPRAPSTVAASESSTAPDDVELVTAAEKRTRQALEVHEDAFAGAVVLVRSGEETRVLTSGWADRPGGRRVRAEDRFPIASLTKPMVAAAVLQYVDAGRFALDSPIERYLPGLLRQGKQITVRHLLAHRSGLHSTDGQGPPPARTNDREVLELSDSVPLDFAPGSNGAYSNVGYTVLGLLLEELSGRPLADVLDRRIFRPAGLDETALGGDPSVLGHFAGRPTGDPYLHIYQAAGGVVSTAADYDRFLRALLHTDLLSRDLLEEMSTATGTSPFGAGDYGLGLWLLDFSCGGAIGHSGSMPGFATKAWSLREQDKSVVVLTSDGDALAAADDIAEQALCG